MHGLQGAHFWTASHHSVLVMRNDGLLVELACRLLSAPHNLVQSFKQAFIYNQKFYFCNLRLCPSG